MAQRTTFLDALPNLLKVKFSPQRSRSKKSPDSRTTSSDDGDEMGSRLSLPSLSSTTFDSSISDDNMASPLSSPLIFQGKFIRQFTKSSSSSCAGSMTTETFPLVDDESRISQSIESRYTEDESMNKSTIVSEDSRSCPNIVHQAVENIKQDDGQAIERAQNNYSVLDGLGLGGFSTVVKVEETNSKKHYAMKVICKKNMKIIGGSRSSYRDQIAFEVEAMATMKSPFIQKCYDTFENKRNVFLILELMEGGDLFYHLTNMIKMQRQESVGFQGCPEPCAKIMLAELYLAIEHVHQCDIIHGDIKIENVMFDRDGHVKLIDFGMAVKMESEFVKKLEGGVGSITYASPEMINERLGGRHTDWWAYGILAHELMTGKTPWTNLSDEIKIRIEIISTKVIPPSFLSRGAKKLINDLLCKDCHDRLGTMKDDEIKSSLFFKGIDWEKTARLECPSAFTPIANVNITNEERLDALHAYQEMCLRSQDRRSRNKQTTRTL